MTKILTITNTRPNSETLWFFQTNPPQNIEMDEWLETNKDKVTFQYDFSIDRNTQVLQYTFADEAVAEEFVTFATSGNHDSALNDYQTSVGITSTTTITDG